MVFKNAIPQPTDNLDQSQIDLLGNMQQLDTTFGIDHYKFSDITANNGFHNKLTTPVFVDSPPTGLPPVTTTNPILYAIQQSANLGVLQYSRGPSNAVPTPLTKFQSPAAGINLPNNTPTNVLDFTGLPGVVCKLYSASMALGSPSFLEYIIAWNSASFNFVNVIKAQDLQAQNSGAILQIRNVSGSPVNVVVWTLEFMRIS